MDRTQLTQVITSARAKLDRIERKERYQRSIELLGKCYRTKNNYGCPEKASDYWWLYVRIVKVDTDGSLSAFQFQTDKNREISIKPNRRIYNPHSVGGYQEITLKDFKKAMKAMEIKSAKECAAARRAISTKGA